MRKIFAAFLTVCLLTQVSAGMTMQMDMVIAAQGIHAADTQMLQVMPPCHTDNDQATVQDSSKVQHNHCSQCCVPALIPTVLTFTSESTAHPAPTATLFNSLPAPVQPPVKPPLV